MPTLALPRLDQPTDYGTSTGKLDRIQWKAGLSLVSYGVRIGIRVSESTVLEQLQDYLPPGWEQSSSPDVDELYSLVVSESPDGYQLYRGQEELLQSLDLEDIFDTLDSDLRLQIGILAPDKLFVHAGVVGWRGKAIVIPGRSFSGKTTLVAALVKAGATYYSDEYAVFDANGLVHPYPRRDVYRYGKEMGDECNGVRWRNWGVNRELSLCLWGWRFIPGISQECSGVRIRFRQDRRYWHFWITRWSLASVLILLYRFWLMLSLVL